MSTATTCDIPNNSLDAWLNLAVRDLCATAKARITREITTHVADATDEGIRNGLTFAEASRNAVYDLGDPALTHRTFVREHLTGNEAAILSRCTFPQSPSFIEIPALHFVLTAVGTWLLVMLCAAEYSTLTGGAGNLSPREALFILPWVLWLSHRLVSAMRSVPLQHRLPNIDIRQRFLRFYATMWTGAIATLASTDNTVLAVGLLWLALMTLFSVSRIPLVAKLHRVSSTEVATCCTRPVCTAPSMFR